ncbi:hypothetical protein ACWHAM_02905 [Paenibacillus terrae]
MFLKTKTNSLVLERAAMVFGPYDQSHNYEIFEGVIYDGQYFFHIEDGGLWLRHVLKVEHPEHTHLFVDGDSGGLQLAENIQCDLMEAVSNTIDRLHTMDSMTFLINELLWLNNRGDIKLNFIKKQ